MRLRLVHALLIVCSLAGGAACESPMEPSIDLPPEAPLANAVTGAAAAAIGSDGFFHVQGDSTWGADSLITSARAYALAASSFVQGRYRFVIWVRGEAYVTATYPELVLCGPSRIAPSPLLPIVEPVSWATRLQFGPWYSQAVCDSSGAVRGLLSTAAMATSAGLSDSALRNRLDRLSGVVPFGFYAGVENLFTPEQAARATYRITGRRVREVPTPLARWGSWRITYCWRVVLESAIAVRDAATGARDSLTTLIVSFDGRRTLTYALGTAYENSPTMLLPDVSVDGEATLGNFTAAVADSARRRLSRVYIER